MPAEPLNDRDLRRLQDRIEEARVHTISARYGWTAPRFGAAVPIDSHDVLIKPDLLERLIADALRAPSPSPAAPAPVLEAAWQLRDVVAARVADGFTITELVRGDEIATALRLLLGALPDAAAEACCEKHAEMGTNDGTDCHDRAPSPSPAALSEIEEELTGDLILMMRSRKVLLEGVGKVLLACGNHIDTQERGDFVDGPYTIERAFQDILDAAKAAMLAHNRIMATAAAPEPSPGAPRDESVCCDGDCDHVEVCRKCENPFSELDGEGWCLRCRDSAPEAEPSPAAAGTTTKGSQVTAAFITPECRTNRGDDGAWDEAVDRLREHYDKICQGWGGREAQPTLNLYLTMERP